MMMVILTVFFFFTDSFLKGVASPKKTAFRIKKKENRKKRSPDITAKLLQNAIKDLSYDESMQKFNMRQRLSCSALCTYTTACTP